MTEGPPDDLHETFSRWMNSEVKVQLLAFFHANPGVVETIEGLAVRLGISPEILREEVADQIEMGLLKERQMGDHRVLIYDRTREAEVQGEVARRLRDRLREGPS